MVKKYENIKKNDILNNAKASALNNQIVTLDYAGDKATDVMEKIAQYEAAKLKFEESRTNIKTNKQNNICYTNKITTNNRNKDTYNDN